MSGADVEVKGLFATPVAAVMLPGAEERNAELTEIILRRRAGQPSIGASSIGGWHSTRDIAEWGGKGIQQVLTDGNPIKPDWKVEAWANVIGPGGSNACHYHPGSFWSGTYYVADGGCADDASLGGEFEMFDPRGPSPMMHAPLLKFAGEDGRSAGSAQTIRPRAGLLFLFPSFLLHAVRPYAGNSLRISIAFNLGLYPNS